MSDETNNRAEEHTPSCRVPQSDWTDQDLLTKGEARERLIEEIARTRSRLAQIHTGTGDPAHIDAETALLTRRLNAMESSVATNTTRRRAPHELGKDSGTTPTPPEPGTVRRTDSAGMGSGRRRCRRCRLRRAEFESRRRRDPSCAAPRGRSSPRVPNSSVSPTGTCSLRSVRSSCSSLFGERRSSSLAARVNPHPRY